MNNIIYVFILIFVINQEMLIGDIIWSSPVSISTPVVNATSPNVVIDTNGNATSVWLESGIVKAATLTFGGNWSAPVSISTISNTASLPKLCCDASGNVTAVWIENSVLESATLPFGGSWSSEVAVSTSGVTNFSFDVDASGNAVAVWVRNGSIEASCRKSGIWSSVSVRSSLVSSNPHVKISSNGQAIAVWHSISSGSDIIVSASLTISTNVWAANKNVTTATTALKFDYPKVAIDSNGNATAAAFRYNFNSTTGGYYNVQVLTASLSSGAATWGLPTILSNSGIGNPANLTIKLRADISGNVLAAWTNLYDGMTYSIESTNKLFGGNWPLAIAPQSPSLYSLAFDVSTSQGTALLTSMLWDGINDINIVSQESDISNQLAHGWTNVTQINSNADSAYPSCALNVTSSNLNAVTVWMSYSGTNTSIMASSGTTSVILSPSGVVASQSSTNFGVYTDYYNTITWSPSLDPNLLQYNIYRNGIFYTSTLPDTLSVVDHNQIQNGTVTYGVSAVSKDSRQSTIINYKLF